VNILWVLQKKAKETQDRVDEILGAKSNEDERMNKLADAFVDQLVKNPPERAIRGNAFAIVSYAHEDSTKKRIVSLSPGCEAHSYPPPECDPKPQAHDSFAIISTRAQALRKKDCFRWPRFRRRGVKRIVSICPGPEAYPPSAGSTISQ